MKKTIYTLLFAIGLRLASLPFGEVGGAYAQNIGMNSIGSNPHPSALLDIDAVGTPSLGILIPRIALQAINLSAPVNSPANSLLVFNTATASTGTNAVSSGYYYWDGAKWVRFAYNPSGTSTTAWNITGNAGTVAGTHFLGTTDAQDVVVKTNATENIRILNSNGNVGIGTPSPIRKLHVYSTSNPGSIRNTVDGGFSGIEAFTYSGSGNSHPYFMGLTAKGSSTVPTYPLNGDVLSAFIARDAIDGFVPTNFGGASMYMNATENYSALNKGTNLRFLNTGNGTNTIVERMRIDHNGNVGIGAIAPTEKLEVQGSVKIVDGTQGAGKVLTSDATGKGSWQASSGIPTSAIFYFPTITVPTGYLECNGSAVSRTTFATLFVILGTNYGVGDGSTTFNLPDLRGEFIRCADNGRGVDPARVLGSAQTDDFKSHNHTYAPQTWGGASAVPVGASGNASVTDGEFDGSTIVSGYDRGVVPLVLNNTGITETRPRNIALMACIKY